MAAREQEKRLAEVRLYAQTLEQQARELARSNGELEEFAHVISHDLKEPLRTVRNYLDLLHEKLRPTLSAENGQFLRRAGKAADRMHALIDNLLAYSSITARREPMGAVDASRALHDALENLHAHIEQSQARVTSDHLPTVRTDRHLLVHVFQNLISNALKFRREEPPTVHVSAQSDGPEWIFSIRDNGMGIDPVHFSRIFGVFQRLNRRDDVDGVGIGLAVCKKIVESCGGRIWVDSQPGQGATFSFTLSAPRNPT